MDYSKPVMEVHNFTVEDIITLSVNQIAPPEGDAEWLPPIID